MASPEAPVDRDAAADGALDIGFDVATEIPAPNVTGGCEALFIAVQFASAPCTPFTGLGQAPLGEHIFKQATIRTGPRTGAMRFEIVRAFRSQLPGPNGLPSGIICCFQGPVSETFFPTPNSLNTIPLDLPASNQVVDINGEPVEEVDYLVLTLLDFNSSLPILAGPQFPVVAQLSQPDFNGTRTQGASFLNGVPTISAVPCAVDGSTDDPVCEGVGGGGGGGGTVGDAGDSFTGLNPNRLLDTRDSSRVAAGSTTRVSVADAAGVPAAASGAVLNVTAVNPSDGGFVSVFPCGEAQPNSSNLNFVARQTVANAVAATIGDGGEVCVFSSVETDLLVDLNGALTDGFAGLTPDRLLDTRDSSRVAAGSTTRVQVGGAAGVPAGASGAVLNVTAVNPSNGGFLTVFPCGQTRPNASNVNFAARRNVPNAVVATIGDGGEVCVFSSVQTDLLVDLNGALTSGFAGLSPDRLLDTRESARVAAGSTTQVRVDNAPGVPGSAVAAVLNVTAVNPSDGGFLSVFPCGEAQPNASNVNFVRGQTVANAVAATIGSNGSVCVFSSVETHLLADLNGVFT